MIMKKVNKLTRTKLLIVVALACSLAEEMVNTANAFDVIELIQPKNLKKCALQSYKWAYGASSTENQYNMRGEKENYAVAVVFQSNFYFSWAFSSSSLFLKGFVAKYWLDR